MADKRTCVFNIRVTDTEKAALVAAAREAGVTYTEYVRQVALERVALRRRATAARAPDKASTVEIYSTADVGPDPLQAPHTALSA